MPTYSDEGVVLRRIDYGEADRILTVLTRDHGKIGVIARGVRKPQSRLAARTDLFVRSRMQLAKGRGELDVLTQAEPVSMPSRSADARRAACAAVCAELTDRVFESHHPDDGVYALVVEALAACGDQRRDPRAALVWFERRMIDRLGYAPQLHRCAGCERMLPEATAWFSAAAGGLLCESCARHDLDAIECSVRVIKVLRTAAGGDAELYARLRLDAATLSTLERVVEAELAYHLDRRLRSFDVLRALERQTARPGVVEGGGYVSAASSRSGEAERDNDSEREVEPRSGV
ncbi:MAG: DNA repair protein RecO [Candidatus Dormibacteraeota bacterium]|nr:DNA repair protein RecO [Candidatus Dormibacteraeota bacterium]MBV8444849.1 DNA repair protein RecO [Candidatus Dormibacteraeota bacterium]